MKKKVILPEGVEDLLIDDCHFRREIEGKLMRYLELAGYMEVQTPTLEYYDLFSHDYLSQYGNRMFKLVDTNGSLLVLRPDCTIPIARMVATKMKDFTYPIKLSYLNNVFRMDQEQSGRKREYRQAGVEIFGVDSYKADVEAIVTAIEALLSLGLMEFQIEIGQVKIIKGILKTLETTEDHQVAILQAIENKNLIRLKELLDAFDLQADTQKLIEMLPTLMGNPYDVFTKLNEMVLTRDVEEGLNELKKVLNLVKEYGYEEYIQLDLGMVAHMDYYTGIVFKGFYKGLGTVILSGGRYDGLMEDFGLSCSATGFAFVVNKLIKAIKIQGEYTLSKNKHILIVAADSKYNKASAIAKKDRSEGNIVEIALAEDLDNYIKHRRVDEVMVISNCSEAGGVGYGGS
ncbi:ATP phosphoribosyltransferase regulatory subunit [Alkaliphilus serpentinus]|uniref:ATP phosphoribosyltransferase regulatory subunit n=1 Tax=Alkaliphilus serpentinus TaxID=1482731 RepID=A0A833MB87_9FIRM|nr:ATP phosphoribosyltransferase regulatory subunit [Alkaliphilus serpentinus]KAB3532724.1 ATP phosphoribosyltransferase regulatory subunit [Alkaliphilus serpentinus]